MTYQFGREVTIKLPEPSYVREKDEFAAWIVSEYKFSSRRGRRDSIQVTRYPLEVGESAADLIALAPALLAAADYAEKGDQT